MMHKLSRIMLDASLKGHAFIYRNELIRLLKEKGATDVEDLLKQAVRRGIIVNDQGRYYLPCVLEAEQSVAHMAAIALMQSPAAPVVVPVKSYHGIRLDKTQTAAVQMALSNSISMILGGAGTGKSTIIEAILDNMEDPDQCLLCSPTGKAARNVREKTNNTAMTIHRALSATCGVPLVYSEALLPQYRYVIIDEASMLTLDMLAGIAGAVSAECKIILIGDDGQLPAVGSGNILQDFQRLGIPHIKLDAIYRQPNQASALYYNVSRFRAFSSVQDMHYDDSFILLPCQDSEVQDVLVPLAKSCYSSDLSSMILSPCHTRNPLSVDPINLMLQSRMTGSGAVRLDWKGQPFYANDRVMFTANNHNGSYVNGDTGILHLKREKNWMVSLPTGAEIPLTDQALAHLELAYAMTVHKAQGSAYDRILLPVSEQLPMTRQMLYTALTRARRQVIMIGSAQALDRALNWYAPVRRTALVERVRSLCPAACHFRPPIGA